MAGEYSSDKGFFKPLHASHLGASAEKSFPTGEEHVDLWFDESLLDV